MRRLSTEEKVLIKQLIKSNYSLPKIARLLGKAKTTIYYHQRKLIGRRFEPAGFDDSDQSSLGEFLGAFAGDGSISDSGYHTIIRILLSSAESEYSTILCKFVDKIFQKKTKIYARKEEMTIELRLYDKCIGKIIKKYFAFTPHQKTSTIRLRDFNKLSDNFLKGFARGLIATDGCVSMYKHGSGRLRSIINFSSSSRSLARQYMSILKHFGLNYSVYIRTHTQANKTAKYSDKIGRIVFSRHNLYRINIRGDELKKFNDIFGLTEPNKKRKLDYILNQQRLRQ